MADNLAWEAACRALFGSSSPTIKPLVDLIRSEEPIPTGIREMLAAMIDPDGDGFIYAKLQLISTETDRNNAKKDWDALERVSVYKAFIEDGDSSQDAAIKAGKSAGVSDRTLYRDLKRVAKVLDWWNIQALLHKP